MKPEGMVVWLTGLPASGKSTIARLVESELARLGVVTLMLDSDDLRRVLTPEATYGDRERDQFYRALGHIARLGAEGGAVVLVPATAPRRVHRDRVRGEVRRFIEVHLVCTTEELEARDPKGLYAKARAGLISNLPGVDAVYEAPLHPELTFHTGEMDAPEIAEVLSEEIVHVLRGERPSFEKALGEAEQPVAHR